MGFSREEYWSRLPSPPPGDFPHPGIMSPVLVGVFFTTSEIWLHLQKSVKKFKPWGVLKTSRSCGSKHLMRLLDSLGIQAKPLANCLPGRTRERDSCKEYSLGQNKPPTVILGAILSMQLKFHWPVKQFIPRMLLKTIKQLAGNCCSLIGRWRQRKKQLKKVLPNHCHLRTIWARQGCVPGQHTRLDRVLGGVGWVIDFTKTAWSVTVTSPRGKVLLQEGGPLPGPETGLLSNTWKWIVRGDICIDKAGDFIGKEHLGGEQQGKGTQENNSVTWLDVSGFMGMGLVSGLSLANHSDSRVLPGGACLVQPRWMLERRILGVVGHVVSHFDLSWTLPVDGGLLVPCSLPGPPVLKQLMHMVTRVPGQGGQFQSVCFL